MTYRWAACALSLTLAACGSAPSSARGGRRAQPVEAPAVTEHAEAARASASPCRDGDAETIVDLSEVDPAVRSAILTGAGLLVVTEAGSFEQPATCAALARVTELSLESVTTLRGMEALGALTTLAVRDVADGDVSPLSGLPLRALQVGPPDWDLTDRPQTSIVDFTPIGRIEHLEVLRIASADLRSLAFVADLSRLRVLDVRHNALTDLTPLRGLSALTELHVSSNRVEDLSPLAPLHALGHLDASDNPVADLRPLEGHPALRELVLFDTQILDARPCLSMPVLRAVYLCRSPALSAPPDAAGSRAALEALRARGVELPDERACWAG